MENKSSEQLSKKKMWGYAFGAIPNGIYWIMFSLFYIEFFYDDLKLEWGWMILGWIIYMIVNSFNDPLLGQLSDRTNREKWGGRRIPYIKYGSFIWAATFIMIWFPWSYDNQIIMGIHYIVSICAFDMMLTIVVLCWMALMPEMTSDLDERNKINFLVLLVGLMGILPFMLIGFSTKESSDFSTPPSVIQPFQVLIIVIAIVSTISLLIVAKTSEERPEFRNDEVFSLWKSIKETIKLKSFRFYVGFGFATQLLSSIGLSYLFTYVLILGDPGVALIGFFAVYIFVGYGSNVVCMKLRPKWGMRKIILIFGLMKSIGTFVIFLWIVNPMTEQLIWFGLIWTTFFGGFNVFTTPLMALSMDEDEVKNGTRREGMFLGMNALFTKPASSIGPIIATIILTAFNYQQGSDIQPDSALLGIKILFFIVPVVFTLIGLVFMYFFPLHGKTLEELQSKLEEIHQKKKEQIKETK